VAYRNPVKVGYGKTVTVYNVPRLKFVFVLRDANRNLFQIESTNLSIVLIFSLFLADEEERRKVPVALTGLELGGQRFLHLYRLQ